MERSTPQDSEPAAVSTADILEESLQELAEVRDYAAEDGLDIPSEIASANAERLLKAMYAISPRRFGVYPAPDGYVAIDARGINDRGMVVLCGSAGEAACFVTIDGERRRARYSTARQLPDSFIRDALADLDAKPTRR